MQIATERVCLLSRESLYCYHLNVLRQRRRFADAEKRSRFLQILLNIRGERVHAAKNAPRDSPRVLERRHGLAEIVERGAGVFAERPCVPAGPRMAYQKKKCSS